MKNFMSIPFLIGLFYCLVTSQETYALQLNNTVMAKSQITQTIEPIEDIRRILEKHNLHQEYTDTKENLSTLTNALAYYENNDLTIEGLTLVINLWMYYTIIDFPTLELSERVLFAHREDSIKAIKARILNKEEWETVDNSPFADLSYLLEQLEEDN